MVIRVFKMNKILISFILFFFSGWAYAQQLSDSFTIVTGRVLSPADSTLVREWFYEGLKAKSIQNLQLAVEYFKRIIEIDPANDASLYELAGLAHTQNQEREAEHYAREAVTVAPENKWYWMLLADIYKKTNNLPQLNLVFDELIKIEPEEERYYYEKAQALLMQNKIDEAVQVFDEIERKFGLSDELASQKQQIYLKQGKPEKVIAEIEKQLKKNPDNARNYILLAGLYAENKKNEKALHLLEKAKQLEPENALVRLGLAELYRSEGKDKESFIELKSAFANPIVDIDTKVRIVLSYFSRFTDPAARAEAEELASITAQAHPAEAKAFSVYGDVLFQENKLKEAEEAYRTALGLNKQVYLIWEQLLRIDISQSDFDKAIQDGEEALSLFPNQALLYFYTGIAYSQKKQHGKAVEYLKNAASLETENKALLTQVYSSLGDAYNALKQYKNSDQAYDQSLGYDENNAYTLNNYAYYLALRGENLDKAAIMSQRSNRLDPGNASFQDTYAWVLFKQKKYKEARVWIEKAMENTEGNNSVLAEHYADILFFLGEKDEAVKQWKKAAEYGTQSAVLEKKIKEKKYVE